MSECSVSRAGVANFASFVGRGNVVDLAIGIIIGAAVTGVAGSLVKVVAGVDFSNIFVALNGQSYPTLDAAEKP